jgi:hypothetical protein
MHSDEDVKIYSLMIALVIFLAGCGAGLGYLCIDHNVPIKLSCKAIELCEGNDGIKEMSVDSTVYTVVCNNTARFTGRISYLDVDAEAE